MADNKRTELITYMKSQGFDPIGLDFIKINNKVFIENKDHYDVKEFISISYTEQFYKIKRYFMLKTKVVAEIVPPEMVFKITEIVMKGGMIML